MSHWTDYFPWECYLNDPGYLGYVDGLRGNIPQLFDNVLATPRPSALYVRTYLEGYLPVAAPEHLEWALDLYRQFGGYNWRTYA